MIVRAVLKRALPGLMAAALVAAPAYANDNGWQLPDSANSKSGETGKKSKLDETSQKAMAQGKKMMENSSKEIQFAGCLAFTAVTGPQKVLFDKACKKEIKDMCSLDSKGMPDPPVCIIFPPSSY